MAAKTQTAAKDRVKRPSIIVARMPAEGEEGKYVSEIQ